MAKPKSSTAKDKPMSTDQVVEVPGETAADTSQPETTENAADLAAQLAQVTNENTQLKAALAEANAQLQAVATVPAAAKQIECSRIIGEDWRSKTSAEARAAGVTTTVLCSDGYFVP